MVVSMTGFASSTAVLTAKDGSQTQLSITLKSLNSRFFEANCKLPYALHHLETEFTKIFKENLHRGYIVFSIQASNPAIFKGPIQVDLSAVKGYLDAAQQIKKSYEVSGSLEIANLIMLPNVFSIEEQTIDEQTKKFIFNEVKQVLDKLMHARITEGKALQADLENRIASMKQLMDSIEILANEMMEQRKKEIIARLAALDEASTEVTEAQRSALYYELDKIDIHEEIVRFKNHLETFKKHLLSDELEKGRRLDFIVQELGRETNTIAAKCSNAQISAQAINIKVELEKAREQIQNIV
ncbi:MAG: YicC/YloC family endoribonuclease [Candidatus Babeliales bacterium]